MAISPTRMLEPETASTHHFNQTHSRLSLRRPRPNHHPRPPWHRSQPSRTLLSFPPLVAELAAHLGLEEYRVLGGSAGGAYALACAYAANGNEKRKRELKAVGVTCILRIGSRTRWYCGRRLMGWVLHHYGAKQAMDPDPGVCRRLMEGQMNLASKAERALLMKSPESFEEFLWISRECFRQGVQGYLEEGRIMAGEWGFSLKDGMQDVNTPASMAARSKNAQLESERDPQTLDGLSVFQFTLLYRFERIPPFQSQDPISVKEPREYQELHLSSSFFGDGGCLHTFLSFTTYASTMRYKSNYETIQNTSTKGLWDLVIEVPGSLDVQAVALSFVPDVFLSSSSDLGLVNRLGDQSKRSTGDTVRGRRCRRCRVVLVLGVFVLLLLYFRVR
ncbi:hypothetical protein FIBSPDRAFT_924805 [Athelia psychrophila]|uniref:Uncharacterized protein n=1 Tax=Athelia psychrophila TaxID=1759441 RepID=A0A166W209_9AGAM|nr:hypothetical protein FIBSPDRAFT_924805 [Fibularhizoctonia sp. CBS 109695]